MYEYMSGMQWKWVVQQQARFKFADFFSKILEGMCTNNFLHVCTKNNNILMSSLVSVYNISTRTVVIKILNEWNTEIW